MTPVEADAGVDEDLGPAMAGWRGAPSPAGLAPYFLRLAMRLAERLFFLISGIGVSGIRPVARGTALPPGDTGLA